MSRWADGAAAMVSALVPPRPDAPARPDTQRIGAVWFVPSPKPIVGPWPLATWTLAETVVVFLAAFGTQYFVELVYAGTLGLRGVGARTVAGIVAELGLGGAVIGWLRWGKGSPISTLGLPQKARGDLGFGILVGFGLLVTSAVVEGITRAIAHAIVGHQPAPAPSQTSILTGPWVVPAFLLIVVVAPITEEILFRGFLYQGLRRSFRVFPAMAISAGAFALVHVYPLRIPPIFATGLLLALLYERRRSLLASMTAHATLNGVIVIAYLARR